MLDYTTAESILSRRLSGRFWVTPLSALESARPASTAVPDVLRCAVESRLSKLTFSAKIQFIVSQSFKCYCLASQMKCFCKTPNKRRRAQYFSSWANNWIYLRMSFWGRHCKDILVLLWNREIFLQVTEFQHTRTEEGIGTLLCFESVKAGRRNIWIYSYWGPNISHMRTLILKMHMKVRNYFYRGKIWASEAELI